jgi:hypothetical protein
MASLCSHFRLLGVPTTTPPPSNKLTLNTQKLTCETLSSPSKVVAWECGTCAYTVKDATCHDCILCQTRCPVCYAIMAGAMAAATARTTRVDCHEQACIATLATAAPVVAGEAPTVTSGAVPREVPTATNGPPAVVESVAISPVRAPDWGAIVQVSLRGSAEAAAAAAWRQRSGGSLAAALHQRR